MQSIKSWKKYGYVFGQSIQNQLEYRFNLASRIIKYSVLTLLAAVIWSAVADQPSANIVKSFVINYYLIATIIWGFSNFHPDIIESDIRLGGLAKYAVKPINELWYYYWLLAGQAMSEFVIRLMIFIPLGIWLGTKVSIGVNLVLALLYLPMAFSFAFSIYSSVSALTFWIDEAYGIRWSVIAGVRFLSGLFVPIIFFPEWIQQVLWWLPFTHLASTPILLLINQISWQAGFQGLIILGGWTLISNYCLQRIWQNGSYSFESTGL